MREYRIHAINPLTLPDWSALPRALIETSKWLPAPDGLSAYAQAAYTNENLFVRLCATEANPLCRFDTLFDMVCLDSCLEFFFCPLPDDMRYFNFEFNPAGTMYLGFGFNRYENVRQIIPDYRKKFQVSPFKTSDCWGIDFRIPASFIRIYMPEFELRPGLTLRGNFYKCGEETSNPHFLMWNEINSPTPDFHRPECFGIFQL